MNLIKHFAVSLSSNCNYIQVIENIQIGNLLQPVINLYNLQGALYAAAVIDTMIAEEMQHDKIEITRPANSSLKSMSSGEQKKPCCNTLLLKSRALWWWIIYLTILILQDSKIL